MGDNNHTPHYNRKHWMEGNMLTKSWYHWNIPEPQQLMMLNVFSAWSEICLAVHSNSQQLCKNGGKFVSSVTSVDPSFHSITTHLIIMTVTMRGNVPHSTNQAVNQVDWRLLGQHIVSKWVHSFLDEFVWWSRTPFQFANSFINFLLRYFFRSMSYLRILSVSGCISVVVLLLTPWKLDDNYCT